MPKCIILNVPLGPLAGCVVVSSRHTALESQSKRWKVEKQKCMLMSWDEPRVHTLFDFIYIFRVESTDSDQTNGRMDVRTS